ncbi:unnamed protein product [Arctogadus glacialis]
MGEKERQEEIRYAQFLPILPRFLGATRGEDHKLSPPRYPTIYCPGPAGTTSLHPNPGWLATKASRLVPDLRGRRPYRIMASNSIFDSFGNYGSSLLRGELRLRLLFPFRLLLFHCYLLSVSAEGV